MYQGKDSNMAQIKQEKRPTHKLNSGVYKVQILLAFLMANTATIQDRSMVVYRAILCDTV